MDEVQITVEGPVATVTLHRPEVKNAATPDMWAALERAFTDLGYDPDVRVVVVTGAGGAFCSGADVSGFAAGTNARPQHPLQAMRAVGDTVMALFDLPKPTIARVDGVAAGAGANLALACDLVIAADTARFCEIFARRGLSLDFGGSWLLPRLVGMHKAKELAFLTPMVDASEAEAIGLVNKVVPLDDLDAAVGDWAGRLASGPPTAFALTKTLLNRSFEHSMRDTVIDEATSQAVNLRGADLMEGAKAFMEKRDPEFSGVVTLRWAGVALVFGLTSLLGACGSPASPEVPTDDAQLVQGRSVYGSNCANCHGAAGNGGRGPGLAEGELGARYPDLGDAVAVIANGKGSMPAFGDRLSEAEIEAVIRYIDEIL